MAKKKVTTVTEEVDETPIDYKKDIENKSFEQVATDTPTEEVKEEVKESEKPQEETETIEFDPEAFKKEVADQTRKELLDTLKGDTKEETKENVDEYQEYQKDFFSKNNRQPTWFEVAKFMEEKAIERIDLRENARLKAVEEEQTKQQEAQTKNNEATNKYVKDTLDELYANDKLPKIQNKDDKDDYGLRVQHALLSTVVEVNTKRIAEKLQPKTLKEIFYEDFKPPRQEVAGADAPTHMGRGGYTPDDSQEIDYRRDIQGQSVRGILAKAFKRS